jgi:hypothetical protein
MDSSITDWLQAIFSAGSFVLTIAGLYYVAATLREQGRVNEAQFRLLEIESKRAAREFKPILSVSRLPMDSTDYTRSQGMDRPYAIFSQENIAHEVCLEYIGDGRPLWTLPTPGTWVSDNMLLGKTIGDISPAKHAVIVVTFVVMMGGDIPIRLHYKDEFGHTYYVDYVLKENEAALSTGIPASNHPGKNILGPGRNYTPSVNNIKPATLFPN